MTSLLLASQCLYQSTFLWVCCDEISPLLTSCIMITACCWKLLCNYLLASYCTSFDSSRPKLTVHFHVMCFIDRCCSHSFSLCSVGTWFLYASRLSSLFALKFTGQIIRYAAVEHTLSVNFSWWLCYKFCCMEHCDQVALANVIHNNYRILCVADLISHYTMQIAFLVLFHS